MPVSQEQFDADLATAITAVTGLIAADGDLITAVNALLALPPVIDLTAEDNTVNEAATNLATALAAVQAEITAVQQHLPPVGPAKPA